MRSHDRIKFLHKTNHDLSSDIQKRYSNILIYLFKIYLINTLANLPDTS